MLISAAKFYFLTKISILSIEINQDHELVNYKCTFIPLPLLPLLLFFVSLLWQPCPQVEIGIVNQAD